MNDTRTDAAWLLSQARVSTRHLADLTEDRERLLTELVAAGVTMPDAAEALGIGERTAYRWLARHAPDPDSPTLAEEAEAHRSNRVRKAQARRMEYRRRTEAGEDTTDLAVARLREEGLRVPEGLTGDAQKE